MNAYEPAGSNEYTAVTPDCIRDPKFQQAIKNAYGEEGTCFFREFVRRQAQGRPPPNDLELWQRDDGASCFRHRNDQACFNRADHYHSALRSFC